MRQAYPSDLSDDQWAILEPLLPPAKTGGVPRTVNLREVLNTLFYQNRAGCQVVSQPLRPSPSPTKGGGELLSSPPSLVGKGAGG